MVLLCGMSPLIKHAPEVQVIASLFHEVFLVNVQTEFGSMLQLLVFQMLDNWYSVGMTGSTSTNTKLVIVSCPVGQIVIRGDRVQHPAEDLGNHLAKSF